MRPAQMVLMFHAEQRVPTFHALGSADFEKAPLPIERLGYEEQWREWRTPCGQLVSQLHWVNHPSPPWHRQILHEYDRRPTHMRFDNASAIGRPCSRCFPDLATGDSPGLRTPSTGGGS